MPSPLFGCSPINTQSPEVYNKLCSSHLFVKLFYHWHSYLQTWNFSENGLINFQLTCRFTVVVPGRSLMIASDAIVLYVTWVNTYGVRKAALTAQFRTPLLTLLLRDGKSQTCICNCSFSLIVAFSGTMYFLCVTSWSQIQIKFDNIQYSWQLDNCAQCDNIMSLVQLGMYWLKSLTLFQILIISFLF